MACGSRSSHSWFGYLGSVEQRPSIKFSLKFCMAILWHSVDEYAWEQSGKGYFS